MKHFQTLARQTILNHNQFLRVEQHIVQTPDGQTIFDWSWVITPDFINVVAVTDEGRLICFRQTKYAVGGETLGVVGGYIKPDEDPLEAAKRELLEETGYAAEEWTALGAYWVDGNRGAGRAYPFLARQARLVATPDADDLEALEMLLLTRAEVEAALRQGQFKVLPWTAAVALALLDLD